MNLLLDLFLTFAKIGFFTFGGGYAMISIIEDICVNKKQWITHDEMMNVMVVAESTPGPTAVNCATYVGYRQRGLLGSLITTLGIVLPSFFVILLISNYLDNFLEIAVIANAFRGIKIAVGFLILSAAVTMMKKMKKAPFPRRVLVVATVVMLCVNIFSLNFSSITLMILAGLVSLALFCIKGAPAGPGPGAGPNAEKKGGEVK